MQRWIISTRSKCPDRASSTRPLDAVVPEHAPQFVREVTAQMMRGHGDDLPVSMMPVDGTYPSCNVSV